MKVFSDLIHGIGIIDVDEDARWYSDFLSVRLPPEIKVSPIFLWVYSVYFDEAVPTLWMEMGWVLGHYAQAVL